MIEGLDSLKDEPKPEKVEEEPNKVEASVWRLGPFGRMLTSVYEKDAAWLAEKELASGSEAIFFYAELGAE